MGTRLMDEVIDFVYREPKYKGGIKHEVMVYKRFKKATATQFRRNPFISFLVHFFNDNIFEEYTEKLALPKLRTYMRKRIQDFL